MLHLLQLYNIMLILSKDCQWKRPPLMKKVNGGQTVMLKIPDSQILTSAYSSHIARILCCAC